MCHVETGENVAKGIRTSRELKEKRSKKVAAALLVDISKVEIKICDQSQSSLAQLRNIVDDCRATRL